MMFRHHKDPLYYDLNASSKIFVPVEPENNLDENKRKIIESFPAEDRGKVLEPEEYKKKGYGQQEQGNFVVGQGDNLENMIETDQLTAAFKL